MTCVMLLPSEAYKAARPKIKNHHLTVAYFGKNTTQEDVSRLNRSVERWAYQIGGPLKAKANGIGMFDAGEDGVAIVDLIDGIGTLQTRSLVEASYGMGRTGYTLDPLKIDYTHGFTPHMTKEYLDREDDYYAEICVDMVPSIEFEFVAIGVWTGPHDATVKYEVAL